MPKKSKRRSGPFVCEYCGHEFKTSQALSSHIKFKHPGAVPGSHQVTMAKHTLQEILSLALVAPEASSPEGRETLHRVREQEVRLRLALISLALDAIGKMDFLTRIISRIQDNLDKALSSDQLEKMRLKDRVFLLEMFNKMAQRQTSMVTGLLSTKVEHNTFYNAVFNILSKQVQVNDPRVLESMSEKFGYRKDLTPQDKSILQRFLADVNKAITNGQSGGAGHPVTATSDCVGDVSRGDGGEVISGGDAGASGASEEES